MGRSKQEFDYDSLDAETREFLKAKEKKIKQNIISMVFELGKILSETRKEMATRDFQLWVVDEMLCPYDIALSVINIYNEKSEEKAFSFFIENKEYQDIVFDWTQNI